MNPRYSRQIALPEVGAKGQKKLSQASVLVVGAGGLGCPALLALTAAGVGRIGIVDGDRVELSNLHRQMLYRESDVGRLKAEAAAERLRERNSEVEIETHPVYLSSENGMEIIGGYDIIIDGTDNFPTRYLINDASVLSGKPFVYGSIYRFEGQLSLFNHLREDGVRGPNYRDLFPEPPPAELAPDCADAGVLGVLPTMIGTMQAAETIKWIAGLDGLLDGRLLLFDALHLESRHVGLSKRDDNPLTGATPKITGLIDYEVFCRSGSADESIPEITPAELSEKLKRGESVRLIDVRSPEEHRAFNIGGELIPVEKLDPDSFCSEHGRPSLFYCRTGRRSGKVVQRLIDSGAENLFNLQGGMEAWKRIINS
ncbi:MAG: ThiF family adenylyltransferase [Balneolaceae bacterium]|nr:ThiF family adenylyltransferase [Balneolaceae bacterium]MCH8547835.1 ThiF family adenylyltransferase [Balneolaceae bacterium]